MPSLPPIAARVHPAVCCLLLVFSLLLIEAGCRTAPVTGRRQLLLIPEQQEIQMGVQGYEQVMQEETRSDRQDLQAMVERVGQRIAAVSGRPDYQWEFHLLKSPEMNAFALPGGKVAIYEGILPICQNEAGLAVVMSHEVAHALARHGGERMSQQAVVGGLGKMIEAGTQSQEEYNREMILAMYGGAAKYGFSLPYSRKHESEADQIGLMLMAKAGYDPREAPHFWERFATATSGKPPEFLSTHPSDQRRAADLRRELPKALENYEAAPQQYALGDVIEYDGVQHAKATAIDWNEGAGEKQTVETATFSEPTFK